MKNCLIAGLFALLLPLGTAALSAQNPDNSAYLFAYFTGNDIQDEAIKFALSRDGLNYTALNDNCPVIDSRLISETGGVRDPHIMRTEDGKHFYMVVTDMTSCKGWDSNRGLTLLKSDDLVNWTASVINIQKRYKGNENLKRVWAPQTIYDRDAGKYMVYWSMQHGDGPDIIYYAYANDDFTDFIGKPKPLFIPKDRKSCIDGDIVYKDGVYHMFYKTEGHGNGIRKATTKKLTSGKWTESPDYKQQTDKAVEGAGTFKLIGSDKYILMYDVYMDGRYQFTESTDLAQALHDLHPGVFRFPGGCIVEGTEIPDRYQWKNTVGPVENRPTNLNRWLYTFPHRFFPDYYQSGGLGFYEYFQLAEDIGAEPLPVLNVGLVCQYQNRDLGAHVPVDSLRQYIDDALDLIEFANGSADTKWGALRASMGHPEPFNLKVMAIGNEQWGPEYVERLEPFVKELRAKHPEIKIIGSSGPDSEGDSNGRAYLGIVAPAGFTDTAEKNGHILGIGSPAADGNFDYFWGFAWDRNNPGMNLGTWTETLRRFAAERPLEVRLK
ncbi:MAG: family 43 glycosylhydrolase [Muribaculaceae bacterium]|nr:family 43 glycosylhydrolase [Muribaculaceae bacterium]